MKRIYHSVLSLSPIVIHTCSRGFSQFRGSSFRSILRPRMSKGHRRLQVTLFEPVGIADANGFEWLRMACNRPILRLKRDEPDTKLPASAGADIWSEKIESMELSRHTRVDRPKWHIIRLTYKSMPNEPFNLKASELRYGIWRRRQTSPEAKSFRIRKL